MPDLVFLPGAGGRASFWAGVAGRLTDLGATHCVSYPGFGEKPADPAVRTLDDLYAWVLQHVPADPFVLVAQSMGGVLAARLAIEHPDRVQALVLVATSGGVDMAALGAHEWRAAYREESPELPAYFVDDRTDLTSRLGQIAAPTLLVWGDRDPVSPVEVAERLQSLLPDARTVVVPGGGHDLAASMPDQVATHIETFLADKALVRCPSTPT